MKRIILKVNRGAVLEEVAKTTAYAAAKMDGDTTATSRLATVDEDEEMLLRYWYEARDAFVGALKRFLVAEEEDEDGTLEFTLETGSAFSMTLVDSLKSTLFSYFVNSVIAKWFVLSNKNEAAGYAEAVASYLTDMVRKLLSRTRPKRPVWPPLGPKRRKRHHRHGHCDECEDEEDEDTDDEDEADEDTETDVEDSDGSTEDDGGNA